jgi:hypothetical protein
MNLSAYQTSNITTQNKELIQVLFELSIVNPRA